MNALRSNFANRLLKQRGKYSFIETLKPGACVLDVGCGNNSPLRFKSQRPDCRYIGIDIADYNQAVHPGRCADEYILAEPGEFAASIRHFRGQVDAVISSHNIEHCDAPDDVLRAMVEALRQGGRLYLSFPAEASVRFPHRKGTLNFYDDPTHKAVPGWQPTLSALKRMGLHIDFLAARYRAIPLAALGFLLEPFAALFRCNAIAGSTWALWDSSL
jgi:SAM-dependent methyltransferase